MSEKAVLPVEVGNAIEILKNKGWSVESILVNVVQSIYTLESELDTLVEYVWEDGRADNLMGLTKALVNGYEVEKTPEEKVCQYFDYLEKRYNENLHDRDAGKYHLALVSVKRTLNDLGIKIEGVNA
jgi:hypothetical protein